MYRQVTTQMGDVEKMTAAALHEAGQTDIEIGLSLGIPINNVIHWRAEEGLKANLPAAPVAPDKPLRSPVRSATAPSAPSAPAPMPPVLFPLRPSPPPQPILNGTNVQPEGDNALAIGSDPAGREVNIDAAELLTTRLLVQGNSGSGKSHLLRKVIEESAGLIQQVIIDPEGDFVGLAEMFGHTVVDANTYKLERLAEIARKARQHRGSVILNLELLDPEQQMDAAAAFLNGLFDAPREHWSPALVFVDEAQLFAPASAGEEEKSTRKASLGAMTNLMCRGRKRGLAGVLATQRLAKLHKNVAAEASNFLMGRTFLDIDIARAADLLGLQAKQAEQIRDLTRGEFLGLGPAIAKRPLRVKVGSVMTSVATAPAGIVPLPSLSAGEVASLMLEPDEGERPSPVLRVVQ